MKPKNVLVLGASGACGSRAVKAAQEKGWKVRALLRDSSNAEMPDGVEIVRGDVLDYETVNRLMHGQDAVISGLDIRRRSKANPWSALISPADFTSRTANLIVKAMHYNDVKRVVAVSAAGIGDSRGKVNLPIKLVIRTSSIAKTYLDLEKMEAIYRRSGLDALMVRPVTLVDGAPRGNVRKIGYYKSSSKISRADVGCWMTDALEKPMPFEDKAEMIGWG